MISDGQFWELFKRVLKEKYTGPDGMPSLQSEDLIRPRQIAIVKSGGARWTRLFINRSVYLWSADGRRCDYISGHHPGDVSAQSPNPWNSSVTGVTKLFTPGEWHVKTPLLTGDVEAEMHKFIMSDAALGLDAGNISAAEIAGAVAVGDAMNLKSIGGTAQTALDLTATYVAPTMFAGAVPFALTAGDSAMLAANAARKLLSITNKGTSWAALAAKAIAITGFNDASVFLIMPPNSTYKFQKPSEPPPVAAIRVFTDGALSTVYMQEGS